MSYSVPPFNVREKRVLLEQKVLDFSTELFRNPKLGLGLAIILNILYLYLYFNSRSVTSILLYFSLAYFGLSILLSKILGLQRNK